MRRKMSDMFSEEPISKKLSEEECRYIDGGKGYKTSVTLRSIVKPKVSVVQSDDGFKVSVNSNSIEFNVTDMEDSKVVNVSAK